jgi:hypothetical protein
MLDEALPLERKMAMMAKVASNTASVRLLATKILLRLNPARHVSYSLINTP